MGVPKREIREDKLWKKKKIDCTSFKDSAKNLLY
jgi:hypothetical protein